MNIQEEIDELKAKLEILEKELEQQNQRRPKRWRACQEQVYWAINHKDGDIMIYSECGDDVDNYHYISGNYFKTEWQALDYRDNVLIKQQLKDLALELNRGAQLRWDDQYQTKYYIHYYEKQNQLCLNDTTVGHSIGGIYCLDKYFLQIALKQIGEENIIKLIKSGI